MLQVANKIMPSSSRKKCRLYMPDFILAVWDHLNLDKPLNTTVFACLTTCFYASARLGKFTVQTIGCFSPNMHITPQNLSYDQDHNGFKVVLHLLRTKLVGSKGEDVYWDSQDGDTDPTKALAQHL